MLTDSYMANEETFPTCSYYLYDTVEGYAVQVKKKSKLVKQQELITKQAEKINLYMKFQMRRLEFRQNNFCIECSKIIPNQQTLGMCLVCYEKIFESK